LAERRDMPAKGPSWRLDNANHMLRSAPPVISEREDRARTALRITAIVLAGARSRCMGCFSHFCAHAGRARAPWRRWAAWRRPVHHKML